VLLVFLATKVTLVQQETLVLVIRERLVLRAIPELLVRLV